jgi:hypothetical protein
VEIIAVKKGQSSFLSQFFPDGCFSGAGHSHDIDDTSLHKYVPRPGVAGLRYCKPACRQAGTPRNSLRLLYFLFASLREIKGE